MLNAMYVPVLSRLDRKRWGLMAARWLRAGWSFSMLLTGLTGAAQEPSSTLPKSEANPAVVAPAPPTVSPSGQVALGPGELLLPKGTLIPMELLQEVSTSVSKPGDIFELRVLEAVRVSDQVAIPAEALANGEVIDAQKGGFGGKPGKLLITIRSVAVRGQNIPLRLFHPSNGKDNTGTSMGVSMVLGPLGLLVKGGDLAIPKGTTLTAKVAKDTLVQVFEAPQGASPAVQPVNAPVTTPEVAPTTPPATQPPTGVTP